MIANMYDRFKWLVQMLSNVNTYFICFIRLLVFHANSSDSELTFSPKVSYYTSTPSLVKIARCRFTCTPTLNL